MAHDDQFTALGPSNTGSGFPRAAFSTSASDMVYGVNVAGERCGVYGESLIPQGSDREADVTGVGVFGAGENFGVFGKGGPGISGVFGQHNRGGTGIIGAAMRGGTGIVGASLGSLGNPLDTFRTIDDEDVLSSHSNFRLGTGTGVIGLSDRGTGVRGASGEGTGGEFTSESGAGGIGHSDSGTGLQGIGNVGVEGGGASIGVHGHGVDRAPAETGVKGEGGIGVEGAGGTTGVKGTGQVGVVGEGERGAVFKSSLAQIRLVPISLRTPVGNIEGEAGDLVATQAGSDACGLWFCTRSGDKEHAQWGRVRLSGA